MQVGLNAGEGVNHKRCPPAEHLWQQLQDSCINGDIDLPCSAHLLLEHQHARPDVQVAASSMPSSLNAVISTRPQAKVRQARQRSDPRTHPRTQVSARNTLSAARHCSAHQDASVRDSRACASGRDSNASHRVPESEVHRIHGTSSDAASSRGNALDHVELNATQSCFRGRRFTSSGTSDIDARSSSTHSRSYIATAVHAVSRAVVKRIQSAAALTKDNECVICMDARKSVGFVHGRCIHMCACRQCANRWYTERGTCPVCNDPVTGILPIFK
jgi:Zinc finger, C3HC4 type (RING finger)